MRILLVSLLLTLGILGLSAGPAGAVEPSGPFCFKTNALGGTVLGFFVLPMGNLAPSIGEGSTVSLTGANIQGFVPLSGTGFVNPSGTQFQFELSGAFGAIGDALQVWHGLVNIGTGTGTGRCFGGLGCGAGLAVTYTVQACP